jgi:hypothetical protein
MHSRTLCAGHGRESLVFGRIVSNPTFYFEASIRASVKNVDIVMASAASEMIAGRGADQ